MAISNSNEWIVLDYTVEMISIYFMSYVNSKTNMYWIISLNR